MSVREGMLRAEFRDWYPAIEPGVWYSAAWLSAEVLTQQRMGGPMWALDERVLSSAHFSFRGGKRTRMPARGERRRRAAEALASRGRLLGDQPNEARVSPERNP